MATRVLIVDDEADITMVLQKGLELRGFAVTALNNATRALDGYKAGSFDIILLDIRMPDMNGFDLARSIWKLDPDANICFLTSFEIYEKEAASVFPSMKQRCFLRKPISPEQLASHIENQLTLKSPDLTSLI